MTSSSYPDTPDGRYFVVRGRLWRKSNPALKEGRRVELVSDLMRGRSAVRLARRDQDREAMIRARTIVNDAKVALGERGPVWWSDGAPDLNRHMARTTVYADWFEGLDTVPE